MKSNSNARKGVKNVAFGVLSQAVTIVLGIIIPRLFLVGYGSEMNGLLNSVSQIFVYMTLLEAGVGAATTQALYKPLGERNRQSVNGILSATNSYYKKLGWIYLAAVMALSAVYPFIIQSNIPYGVIAGIVFLNGISGVINFFFLGKLQLLLQADGRNYYITNVNLLIHVAVSLSKICLILLGSNILLIQTASMLLNVSKLLFVYFYIKKTYPWLNTSSKPDFGAIAQKNSALIHQISDMVFRNTDILVLTFAPNCGLLVVSVYTMYTMLFSMINVAINTLGSGVEFIMGQTFNTNREKYIRLHDVYETFGMALIFALFTTAYLLILPFMKLYTSGISDINYIDKYLPILFILTYFMTAGRRASALVINFAQHFKKTQGRAILEAVINLTSSILLVLWLGIYGVLLGTVAGLIYRTNDMILYSNHVILKRSAWPTYRRWLTNLALFLFFAFVGSFVLQSIHLDTYIKIIVVAVITVIVSITLFLAVNAAVNIKAFRDAKQFALPYFKKLRRKTG